MYICVTDPYSHSYIPVFMVAFRKCDVKRFVADVQSWIGLGRSKSNPIFIPHFPVPACQSSIEELILIT